MTPVALGVGVVLLIAAFGEDDAEFGRGLGPTAGSLRVGRGGVPSAYAPMILKAAADCEAGLQPAVLGAQLKQESNFDPQARSPGVGAQGIAQFMPGTWPTWATDGNGNGTRSVWEPADAIAGQGRFMCSLMRKGRAHPQYDGSPTELALAGYNAGWGRVDEYRGVPPAEFARGQTFHYVRNIMALAKKFTAPASSGEVRLPAGYTLPSGTPREVRTAVRSPGRCGRGAAGTGSAATAPMPTGAIRPTGATAPPSCNGPTERPASASRESPTTR
uniref:lytic transglycosylase domain-containing protein n=1 Tax=Streptomyces sp. PAMC 26508 TaxID=1265601 RepID=UPI001EF10E9A|nr:lytic transglycosylase domain-containing protein [Streptomyces sp. PAMC 26508]